MKIIAPLTLSLRKTIEALVGGLPADDADVGAILSDDGIVLAGRRPPSAVQVWSWAREPGGLAGRDLAGAALAGIVLDRADLQGALLERADLTGASLRGADLRNAVLTGAVLDDADCSGARLDGACLDDSRAERCRLAGAHLTGARARRANWAYADLSDSTLDELAATGLDLTHAVLDRSRGRGMVLLDLQADHSRWRGARWEQVVALQASFVDADFRQCRMKGCAIGGARLQGSAWAHADLRALKLGAGTDLRRAGMRGLHARECEALDVVLAGADLAGATFERCNMPGCDLRSACLDDTRFLQSNLAGAQRGERAGPGEARRGPQGLTRWTDVAPGRPVAEARASRPRLTLVRNNAGQKP